jgi:hypothetical protein
LRELGDEDALAMAELIEQNNTLVEQEPEI